MRQDIQNISWFEVASSIQTLRSKKSIPVQVSRMRKVVYTKVGCRIPLRNPRNAGVPVPYTAVVTVSVVLTSKVTYLGLLSGSVFTEKPCTAKYTAEKMIHQLVDPFERCKEAGDDQLVFSNSTEKSRNGLGASALWAVLFS